MNKKLILSTAILAMIGSSNVNAELITFDELDLLGNGAIFIPDGYHDFDWDNNFVAVDGDYWLWLKTGYHLGSVSDPNVAVNGSAARAGFTSTTNEFDLHSLYVIKGSTSGMTHFDGYVYNVLTYSIDVFSLKTEPTFVTFDWVGLNKVVMSNGDAGDDPSAIDNVDFSYGNPLNFPVITPPTQPDNTISPVPEPSTYAMLLAGLGLMGIGLSRK